MSGYLWARVCNCCWERGSSTLTMESSLICSSNDMLMMQPTFTIAPYIVTLITTSTSTPSFREDAPSRQFGEYSLDEPEGCKDERDQTGHIQRPRDVEHSRSAGDAKSPACPMRL